MSGRAIVTRALRLYKVFLSPLMPPACRFLPTCSEYAAEAVERHGVALGAFLTARRLARCHPWSEGGLDPVPGHLHYPEA